MWNPRAYGRLYSLLMRIAVISRLTFFLSIVLLLPGCAISKPIHQPGLVTHWNRQSPSPPIEAPPIALVLYSRRTIYDDRPSPSWLCVGFSKRAIEHNLQKSLLLIPALKHAQVGIKNARYRLVIEATHAIHSSEALAFLNVCSLFLIPYKAENALELDGSLYRDATLLKQYHARGSFQVRFHLLHLLPIGWQFGVPGRTMEDTFLDLFLQIQQDAEQLFGTTGHT